MRRAKVDVVVGPQAYHNLPRLVADAAAGTPAQVDGDPAAAMRYTECRMAPLAMEMVRDIDEDTVDMQDNYDGKQQEPVVLPARYPNLLVNGSAGIAVGMATNIPPHNLNEVVDACLHLLKNPDASLDELMEIIPAPDFPTAGIIYGLSGVRDGYRTGRGRVVMRAKCHFEDIDRGQRQAIIVDELPYQVNPDNLADKIAQLVRDGAIGGIADIRDETSGRTGQRLVIVLKRDAVAKVVLNNLYKRTSLQENFSANMLSIVDGVPRTLRLDQMLRFYVKHQIDVIVRRTRYRLRKAEERAHILRGLVKALDAHRVLYGDRGQRHGAVDAQHGEGAHVGLDPGAATGIRACDDQDVRDKAPLPQAGGDGGGKARGDGLHETPGPPPPPPPPPLFFFFFFFF